MADLDPVLCAEPQRLDSLVVEVIFESSVLFGEAAAQREFLPEAITDRLA